MASSTSVWVSWRGNKGRWEVGFYWPEPVTGKVRQHVFYTWTPPGMKLIRFTRANEGIAHQLADYIRGRMLPNEQGICTFDPYQFKGQGRKSPFAFSKYVDTWLETYRQMTRTGDLSSEYYDHLCRYNRLYWTPKFGDMDLHEINEIAVKQFYLWVCDQGKGKKYVQHIMDGLKNLLGDAGREIRTVTVPSFPKYKAPKKIRHKDNWLTREEQDHVLSFIPEIHKPIVLTVFYHGLRLIEVRRARRSWFHKEGYLEVQTAKGGVDRRIYLEPPVLKAVKGIPPALNHDYLFHHHGTPYAKTTLWKIIRVALDSAGKQGVDPNEAGRHSFGSWRTSLGQPTRSLQYEMGHADIRTTETYTHPEPEDQAKWWGNATKQTVNK